MVCCDGLECPEIVCQKCYAALLVSGEHQCGYGQKCLRVAIKTGKLRKGKQKKTAVFCSHDLKKCPSCDAVTCLSCIADLWECRCTSHEYKGCNVDVSGVCHGCVVKCAACRRELIKKHAVIVEATGEYACQNAKCKQEIEAKKLDADVDGGSGADF